MQKTFLVLLSLISISCVSFGSQSKSCSSILLSFEDLVAQNATNIGKIDLRRQFSQMAANESDYQNKESEPLDISSYGRTALDFLNDFNNLLSAKSIPEPTQADIWKFHGTLAYVHLYIQNASSGKTSMTNDEYSALNLKYKETAQLLKDTHFFENAAAKGYTLVPKPSDKITTSLPSELLSFFNFYPLSLKLVQIELNHLHGLDELYPDEIRRSLLVRTDRTRAINDLNTTLIELLNALEKVSADTNLSDYDLEPAQETISEVEQIIDSRFMEYCIQKLEKSIYSESRESSEKLKATITRARGLFVRFKTKEEKGLHIIGKKKITINDHDAYNLIQSFASLHAKEFQSDFLFIANDFLDNTLSNWDSENAKLELTPAFANKIIYITGIFQNTVEEKKPRPGFISRHFSSTKLEIENYEQALLKLKKLRNLMMPIVK